MKGSPQMSAKHSSTTPPADVSDAFAHAARNWLDLYFVEVIDPAGRPVAVPFTHRGAAELAAYANRTEVVEYSAERIAEARYSPAAVQRAADTCSALLSRL